MWLILQHNVNNEPMSRVSTTYVNNETKLLFSQHNVDNESMSYNSYSISQ